MKTETADVVQRGGQAKCSRGPDISKIIKALEKSRLASPDRLFGPVLPPGMTSQQQAIDEFVAAQWDLDGKASRQFAKILRKQAAETAVLRKRLDSEALAKSKKWGARLRKEFEDRVTLLPPDRYKRHFIGKPFLISTDILPTDAELNADVAVAPAASWVRFEVDTTILINAYAYFHYLWTNDSAQTVTVNIDGYLIFDGYVELQSDGGFLPGNRNAEVYLTARMEAWEWWHQPASLPPWQGSQVQQALHMKVSSEGFAAGAGFDAKALFRGYDLQYQQLTMPAYGSVVIQLYVQVIAGANYGRAHVDFRKQQRDLLSPGVLITVL